MSKTKDNKIPLMSRYASYLWNGKWLYILFGFVNNEWRNKVEKLAYIYLRQPLFEFKKLI